MGCINQKPFIETSIQKTTKFAVSKKGNHDENIKIGYFVTSKYQFRSFKQTYKLEKLIGTGSFGNIFKAIHKPTNTVRSVKIVETNKLRPMEIKRIWKQVDIIKKLDHPHIIKVFQAFNQKNRFYTITQFCEGGQLIDHISKRQLTQKDIASILKQILQAINYCHLNGVIHRNLRPDNILVQDKTAPILIKLSDFGFASKTTQYSVKLKEIVGSIQYLAPEVFQKQYNEKCDIWSCGIILYILMTGKTPFNGRNDKQIIQNIKNAQYDREILPVSKGTQLLKFMLQKNPKLRLNAEQCLKHQFITNADFNQNLNLSGALLSLKRFNIQNKLQTFAWMYTYHNMASLSQKDTLLKQFSILDTNNDGYLERQQLINGFVKSMNFDVQTAIIEADKILKILDKNSNRAIDYSQFVAATINRRRYITQKSILSIFHMLDFDQNGIISKEDINQIFNNCVSEKYMQQLMKVDSYEKIKDISYDIFKKLMHKISRIEGDNFNN